MDPAPQDPRSTPLGWLGSTVAATVGIFTSAALYGRFQGPDNIYYLPQPETDVFISYCEADQRFRDLLFTHLRPLRRRGTLVFTDCMIAPGAPWREISEIALRSAVVVILLISAQYFDTDEIMSSQLPYLLDSAHGDATRRTTIIPVIVNYCMPEEYEDLMKLRPVNDPERPAADLPKAKQQKLFRDVARYVRLELERREKL